MYKIVIIGANGKMGKLAEETINQMVNFSIVAKITRGNNLSEVLKSFKPDIAIDLTSYTCVRENALTIIKNGVRPVIGTSGLLENEIEELQVCCQEQQLGGLFIPNFSVGMACINKLLRELKPYFSDFSIVEFHHAQKQDKPSGTARYTANMLGIDEKHIASIRTNGFLAKQQVYINSENERIIIDQESFSRNSFMQGIQLSITKVLQLNQFIVGLENIL